MKRQLWKFAALLGLGLALGGCGSGDESSAPVPAPVQPQSADDVPTSAKASPAAFSSFAKSLPKSETAPPLNISKTTPPVSETEPPLAL